MGRAKTEEILEQRTATLRANCVRRLRQTNKRGERESLADLYALRFGFDAMAMLEEAATRTI